jgi:hypothetical protein
VQSGHDDAHVGRDSRADHVEPVPRTVPGPTLRERIEAVTEDPRRLVRQERVLAPPAFSVPLVERVDIDVAAVVVVR